MLTAYGIRTADHLGLMALSAAARDERRAAAARSEGLRGVRRAMLTYLAGALSMAGILTALSAMAYGEGNPFRPAPWVGAGPWDNMMLFAMGAATIVIVVVQRWMSRSLQRAAWAARLRTSAVPTSLGGGAVLVAAGAVAFLTPFAVHGEIAAREPAVEVTATVSDACKQRMRPAANCWGRWRIEEKEYAGEVLVLSRTVESPVVLRVAAADPTVALTGRDAWGFRYGAWIATVPLVALAVRWIIAVRRFTISLHRRASPPPATV